MQRRAFLAAALVGLVVPPGALDSAARLDPVSDSGPLARQVAELEATVHRRALDFPTTPTIDQVPRLLRDYGGFRRLAGEAGVHLRFRVEGALGQLCAFVGANLSTWQEYDDAHAWYGAGLRHAERGGARDVTAWIAARSTLMAVHQDNPRQAIEDAAHAVALSPPGQLGSTLGNALAASTVVPVGPIRLGDAHGPGRVRTGPPTPGPGPPTYPPGSATDTTMLRLDAAEGLAREGYPDAAADAAVEALGLLPDEHLAPILLDRAVAVGRLLGPERARVREAIRARL